MNHPTEDTLLLAAYGELSDADGTALEGHLATCASCRDALTRLERARAALDVALPVRRTRFARVRWVLPALAAAAVLVVLLSARDRTPADAVRGWDPPAVWSATAGYIAGGNVLVEIDAQLTRLEQERYYGLPN